MMICWGKISESFSAISATKFPIRPPFEAFAKICTFLMFASIHLQFSKMRIYAEPKYMFANFEIFAKFDGELHIEKSTQVF